MNSLRAAMMSANAPKHPPLKSLGAQLPERALRGGQPRAGLRSGVEVEARMAREQLRARKVLIGGVVVHDQMEVRVGEVTDRKSRSHSRWRYFRRDTSQQSGASLSQA